MDEDEDDEACHPDDDIYECPMCRGDGMHPIDDLLLCPWCGGEGIDL